MFASGGTTSALGLRSVNMSLHKIAELRRNIKNEQTFRLLKNIKLCCSFFSKFICARDNLHLFILTKTVIFITKSYLRKWKLIKFNFAVVEIEDNWTNCLF